MDLLTHLYRHHKWANIALVDHLAARPPEDLLRKAPGGFGTIQETLFHLLTNEARFIDSLAGRDLSSSELPSELPGCDTLRKWAADQGDQLIQYAGSLTEDSRITGKFNGQPFDLPAYVPLFQAYSHAVEHRTNITSILATYDLPSPELSLWAFMEAGHAQ